MKRPLPLPRPPAPPVLVQPPKPPVQLAGRAAIAFAAQLAGAHGRHAGGILGVPRFLVRGRAGNDKEVRERVVERAAPGVSIHFAVHPLFRLIDRSRVVRTTAAPSLIRQAVREDAPHTVSSAAAAPGSKPPGGGSSNANSGTGARWALRRVETAISKQPAVQVVPGTRIEQTITRSPRYLTPQAAPNRPPMRPPETEEDNKTPESRNSVTDLPRPESLSPMSGTQAVEVLAQAVLGKIDQRLLAERERRERWL